VRNRLRELRAARRWSQSDLADSLEVSRQTVNAIETGRYDPSLPLAFKIAAVFGQSIESLFSPVDDPPPTEISQQNGHDGPALPRRSESSRPKQK
jgi:putative transcriptional regulator